MVKKVERELVATIKANERDFTRGMDKASKSVTSFRKKVSATSSKVAASLSAIAKPAAAVAASMAAIGVAVRKYVGQAADLQNTADNIGVNVEALQELRFAAEQSGSSASDLDFALAAMNRRIGEAARGNKVYAETFKELGVDVDAVLSGQLSLEDAFKTAADSISGYTSNAEKASKASVILGDDVGKRMVKLLSQGEAGIRSLAETARDSGIVIEEGMTQAAVKIEDKYNKLITEIESDLTRLAVQVGSIFFDLRENEEKLNDLLAEQNNIEKHLEKGRGRGLAQLAARRKEIKEEVELLQEAIKREKEREATVRSTSTARSSSILTDQSGGAVPKPFMTKKGKEALKELQEAGKEFDRDFENIAENLDSAFENTFDNIAKGTDDLGQSFRDLAIEIAKATVKMAILQQFGVQDRKTGLGGTLASTLGSALGSTIFGGTPSIGITGGTSAGGVPIPGLSGKGLALAGARAAGGPVAGGSSYLVGEKGPEIFTPNTSGMITSNRDAQNMGGSVINIDARGAESGVEQKIASVMREITSLRGEVPKISINSVAEANRRNPALLGK